MFTKLDLYSNSAVNIPKQFKKFNKTGMAFYNKRNTQF